MNMTTIPRDTDQITDAIRSAATSTVERIDFDAVADSFGDLASSARHVAEDVASATSTAATTGGRTVTKYVSRTVVTTVGAARRHPRLALSGAVAIVALVAALLWWTRRDDDESSDEIAFPRAA